MGSAAQAGESPVAGEEWVELGHVIGAHGVRGGLRVHSGTRPADAIGAYRRWRLAGPDGVFDLRLEGLGYQGKNLVARLESVTDRDRAEALAGARIMVRAEDLPPPAPGEYYWRDLIGCSVVTLDDQPLGEVAQMMETGANDVMVVRGDRERLLPFTIGHAVREVDLDRRRIRVDWDPGF
ncbi:MAG: ribosome maturation factor RimM [Halothiobacillaceae bacterium]